LYEGLEAALKRVERYGSAGEEQIARAPAVYELRFLYEHPVAVVDRGKVRIGTRIYGSGPLQSDEIPGH